jgi:hypothetical protein
MLPVPRPAPPGVGYHRTDIPYLIWLVITAGLTLFCIWYAFGYTREPSDAMMSLLAAAGFGLFAGIFTAVWMVRRGRRKRVMVFGRAVPGRHLQDVNVNVVSRVGTRVANTFTFQNVIVGFEDKQVYLPGRLDNPNAPVFVDGPWAGMYFAAERRVEIAKWGPLSPKYRR